MLCRTLKAGNKVKKSESLPITNNLISMHQFSEEEVKRLKMSLLSWYDLNKRNLPWRKISSENPHQRAYAVWVSEIMLQQTQVVTVIDYYNKWMKKWPTVQDLAASNIEEVNKAWSGLGYYSRGRRLLEGAQKVVKEMSGQMPNTAVELEKKLPGVGRYTAGAIASIALGEVTGLVDGNVVRVLSRLRMIGALTTQPDVMETFWSLANQIVDSVRPGDFNQSLMELGAVVCTPKTPSCGQCPVKNMCRAYSMIERSKERSTKKVCKPPSIDTRNDLIDIECLIPDCNLCLPSDQPWDKELGVLNFPRKPKKAAPKKEEINVLILTLASNQDIKEETRFLIHQRPAKGLLAGLWEFPTSTGNIKMAEALSRQYGFHEDSVRCLRSIGEITHIFSHVHHLYKIWAASLAKDQNVLSREDNFLSKWLTESQLKETAMSTGMRKVFKVYKDSCEPQKPNFKRKRETTIEDATTTSLKRIQPSISDFLTRK
ncbi:unnamed protein product [Lymnaea stagnalis]|uniref:Adenine DNA glycosylase n=1 Tax=Lymnaea stagnalis TaxID=6523 RepID=A0AAV2HPK2_LYMST